jgi:hypothetical protein
MTSYNDPWYITAVTLIIGLGGLGLVTMTVMPREWQNGQGWLIVSYLGIPGFLVVIALLVNAPALLFGALFLIGILAAGK